MDQIQDLNSESDLRAFISKTTGPLSAVAVVQFYHGTSIQWAASTIYQNQKIIKLLSKEISQGIVIFGRIDVSRIQHYGPEFQLNSSGYEVSYGIFWQGMQQAYETDALENNPVNAVVMEVDVLLGMRREMMVGEEARRLLVKRAVMENRRRWPIMGRSLLRRAPRASA
ncbi:hypothetical protein TWF281_001442 [Arthrobotrys megalospora]